MGHQLSLWLSSLPDLEIPSAELVARARRPTR